MLQQTFIGLFAGVVFGLYGFFTKSDPGEGFDTSKLVRTTGTYAVAGAAVGYTGDPITPEAVAEHTAYAVVAGEVLDKGVSKIQRILKGEDANPTTTEG